ncbi:hypothetical protein BDZ91DRAFT_169169 [Kalaharituber pfeilii]|nr:hypothetical protein BDZ91DRAFT_169169 [Kalaharituber pfeilii]
MLSTITRQPLRTVKPHLLKTRRSNLQPGNAAWQIAVLQQRLLKSFETQRLQEIDRLQQNAREEIDRLQQNAREEMDRLQQNAKEEKDRLLKKLEQNSNLKEYSSKILNEYLRLKGKLNLRGALGTENVSVLVRNSILAN